MPNSIAKHLKLLSSALFLTAVTSAGTSAFAQNTGGIFPPVVVKEHRSFQYRTTIDPNTASGETGFAQRLHYQQALDDRFMWRVLGQTRKTEDSDLDFDFVQAELFLDLTEDSAPFQTGVRFDMRWRDDDRPAQFGLNWTNEWNLNDGWQLRAIALSAVQLGKNSADGVFLQTRGHVAKTIGAGKWIGIEMYNNFGSTEDFGSFKTQGHTAGPFVALPIGNGLSIFAGALFGISQAAADTEFRFWLTKSL